MGNRQPRLGTHPGRGHQPALPGRAQTIVKAGGGLSRALGRICGTDETHPPTTTPRNPPKLPAPPFPPPRPPAHPPTHPLQNCTAELFTTSTAERFLPSPPRLPPPAPPSCLPPPTDLRRRAVHRQHRADDRCAARGAHHHVPDAAPVGMQLHGCALLCRAVLRPAAGLRQWASRVLVRCCAAAAFPLTAPASPASPNRSCCSSPYR